MRMYQESDPGFSIIVGKYALNLIQGIRTNLSSASQAAGGNYGSWNTDVYRELAGILISNGRFSEGIKVLDLLKEKEYKEFIRQGASPTEGEIPLTSADAAQRVKLDAERSALATNRALSPDEQARKVFIDKLFVVLRVTAAAFFDHSGRLRVSPGNAHASQGKAMDEDSESVQLRKDLKQNEVARRVANFRLVRVRVFVCAPSELRERSFGFHKVHLQNETARRIEAFWATSGGPRVSCEWS